MTEFNECQPSLENYWRSIVLFGRNVASYKFALGKSLLEFAKKNTEVITLDQLADPFSRYLCEHLKIADKQATSQSSRFLDSCRKFNAGETTPDELIGITSKLGFVNVIDAFHVVNEEKIGVQFFTDERRGSEKGIRLTQDLFRLAEGFQYQNLPSEIEARWRLVETAWELNTPQDTVAVEYDANEKLLVFKTRGNARRPITGCRGALNGYHKGRCFYCFSPITVDTNSEKVAHVDHFLPHILKKNHGFGRVIDRVWNLVLTCKPCNLGKSSKLPDVVLLGRLHTRNNYLIESHHPLRETLIIQTGASEASRRGYLQESYNRAKELLIQTWTPETKDEPAF